MKRWIGIILAIAVIGGIWLYARQQRVIPLWAQPKFGKVTQGDIAVPITASGLIHANQVIEVKSEASGKIVTVPVVEGHYLRKGDLLIELDPVDEQRMLDQRRADLARAEALLTQAEVAVERADISLLTAEANLAEARAQEEIAAYEREKMEAELEQNPNSGVYNKQEVVTIRANHRIAQARVEGAEASVESARLSKRDAEAAVLSQQATVESTRKTVEDAEERLSETTIRAPQNGIVTQVFVREGMLVQSATQTFTGGTLLMHLADVSTKKVIARLNEADYGRVLDVSPISALPEMPQLREAAQEDAEQLEKRSGMVRITVDAFPEDTFEGRIERVEPQGKLNQGSSIIQFDVHVEITDAQRHLLPLGAQAQVEFTVESAESVLRVPAEAVKALEEQRGVYVKAPAEAGEEHGKKFIPCRFGISDGEYTQIVEVMGEHALSEGDQVFTKLPRDAGETQ